MKLASLLWRSLIINIVAFVMIFSPIKFSFAQTAGSPPFLSQPPIRNIPTVAPTTPTGTNVTSTDSGTVTPTTNLNQKKDEPYCMGLKDNDEREKCMDDVCAQIAQNEKNSGTSQAISPVGGIQGQGSADNSGGGDGSDPLFSPGENSCQLRKCNSLTDPTKAKECRDNYAAMKTSTIMNSPESDRLSKAATAIGVVAFVLNLVQAIISNFLASNDECSALSSLLMMASGLVNAGGEIAAFIQDLVDTKKLIDKYNRGEFMFNIVKTKDDVANKVQHTATGQIIADEHSDAQAEAFEFLAAQQKVQLTNLKIRVAFSWASVALMWLGVAAGVAENVALATGSGGNYICLQHQKIQDLLSKIPSGGKGFKDKFGNFLNKDKKEEEAPAAAAESSAPTSGGTVTKPKTAEKKVDQVNVKAAHDEYIQASQKRSQAEVDYNESRANRVKAEDEYSNAVEDHNQKRLDAAKQGKPADDPELVDSGNKVATAKEKLTKATDDANAKQTELKQLKLNELDKEVGYNKQVKLAADNQVADAQGANTAAKNDLEESKGENATANEELASLKKDSNPPKDQLEDAVSKVETSAKSVKENSDRVEETQKQLDKAIADQKAAQTKLDEKINSIDQKKAQVEAMQPDRVGSLSNESTQKQASIDKGIDGVRKKAANVKDLEKNGNADANSAKEDLASASSEVENEISQQKAIHDPVNVDGEIRTKQAQGEVVAKELAKEPGKASEDISILEQKKKNLENEISSLEKIKKSKKEISRAKQVKKANEAHVDKVGGANDKVPQGDLSPATTAKKPEEVTFLSGSRGPVKAKLQADGSYKDPDGFTYKMVQSKKDGSLSLIGTDKYANNNGRPYSVVEDPKNLKITNGTHEVSVTRNADNTYTGSDGQTYKANNVRGEETRLVRADGAPGDSFSFVRAKSAPLETESSSQLPTKQTDVLETGGGPTKNTSTELTPEQVKARAEVEAAQAEEERLGSQRNFAINKDNPESERLRQEGLNEYSNAKEKLDAAKARSQQADETAKKIVAQNASEPGTVNNKSAATPKLKAAQDELSVAQKKLTELERYPTSQERLEGKVRASPSEIENQRQIVKEKQAAVEAEWPENVRAANADWKAKTAEVDAVQKEFVEYQKNQSGHTFQKDNEMSQKLKKALAASDDSFKKMQEERRNAKLDIPKEEAPKTAYKKPEAKAHTQDEIAKQENIANKGARPNSDAARDGNYKEIEGRKLLIMKAENSPDAPPPSFEYKNAKKQDVKITYAGRETRPNGTVVDKFETTTLEANGKVRVDKSELTNLDATPENFGGNGNTPPKYDDDPVIGQKQEAVFKAKRELQRSRDELAKNDASKASVKAAKAKKMYADALVEDVSGVSVNVPQARTVEEAKNLPMKQGEAFADALAKKEGFKNMTPDERAQIIKARAGGDSIELADTILKIKKSDPEFLQSNKNVIEKYLEKSNDFTKAREEYIKSPLQKKLADAETKFSNAQSELNTATGHRNPRNVSSVEEKEPAAPAPGPANGLKDFLEKANALKAAKEKAAAAKPADQNMSESAPVNTNSGNSGADADIVGGSEDSVKAPTTQSGAKNETVVASDQGSSEPKTSAEGKWVKGQLNKDNPSGAKVKIGERADTVTKAELSPEMVGPTEQVHPGFATQAQGEAVSAGLTGPVDPGHVTSPATQAKMEPAMVGPTEQVHPGFATEAKGEAVSAGLTGPVDPGHVTSPATQAKMESAMVGPTEQVHPGFATEAKEGPNLENIFNQSSTAESPKIGEGTVLRPVENSTAANEDMATGQQHAVNNAKDRLASLNQEGNSTPDQLPPTTRRSKEDVPVVEAISGKPKASGATEPSTTTTELTPDQVKAHAEVEASRAELKKLREEQVIGRTLRDGKVNYDTKETTTKLIAEKKKLAAANARLEQANEAAAAPKSSSSSSSSSASISKRPAEPSAVEQKFDTKVAKAQKEYDDLVAEMNQPAKATDPTKPLNGAKDVQASAKEQTSVAQKRQDLQKEIQEIETKQASSGPKNQELEQQLKAKKDELSSLDNGLQKKIDNAKTKLELRQREALAVHKEQAVKDQIATLEYEQKQAGIGSSEHAKINEQLKLKRKELNEIVKEENQIVSDKRSFAKKIHDQSLLSEDVKMKAAAVERQNTVNDLSITKNEVVGRVLDTEAPIASATGSKNSPATGVVAQEDQQSAPPAVPAHDTKASLVKNAQDHLDAENVKLQNLKKNGASPQEIANQKSKIKGIEKSLKAAQKLPDDQGVERQPVTVGEVGPLSPGDANHVVATRAKLEGQEISGSTVSEGEAPPAVPAHDTKASLVKNAQDHLDAENVKLQNLKKNGASPQEIANQKSKIKGIEKSLKAAQKLPDDQGVERQPVTVGEVGPLSPGDANHVVATRAKLEGQEISGSTVSEGEAPPAVPAHDTKASLVKNAQDHLDAENVKLQNLKKNGASPQEIANQKSKIKGIEKSLKAAQKLPDDQLATVGEVGPLSPGDATSPATKAELRPVTVEATEQVHPGFATEAKEAPNLEHVFNKSSAVEPPALAENPKIGEGTVLRPAENSTEEIANNTHEQANNRNTSSQKEGEIVDGENHTLVKKMKIQKEGGELSKKDQDELLRRTRAWRADDEEETPAANNLVKEQAPQEDPALAKANVPVADEAKTEAPFSQPPAAPAAPKLQTAKNAPKASINDENASPSAKESKSLVEAIQSNPREKLRSVNGKVSGRKFRTDDEVSHDKLLQQGFDKKVGKGEEVESTKVDLSAEEVNTIAKSLKETPEARTSLKKRTYNRQVNLGDDLDAQRITAKANSKVNGPKTDTVSLNNDKTFKIEGTLNNESKVNIIGHSQAGSDYVEINGQKVTAAQYADSIAEAYKNGANTGSGNKLKVSVVSCEGAACTPGSGSFAKRLSVALQERGVEAEVTGRTQKMQMANESDVKNFNNKKLVGGGKGQSSTEGNKRIFSTTKDANGNVTTTERTAEYEDFIGKTYKNLKGEEVGTVVSSRDLPDGTHMVVLKDVAEGADDIVLTKPDGSRITAKSSDIRDASDSEYSLEANKINTDVKTIADSPNEVGRELRGTKSVESDLKKVTEDHKAQQEVVEGSAQKVTESENAVKSASNEAGAANLALNKGKAEVSNLQAKQDEFAKTFETDAKTAGKNINELEKTKTDINDAENVKGESAANIEKLQKQKAEESQKLEANLNEKKRELKTLEDNKNRLKKSKNSSKKRLDAIDKQKETLSSEIGTLESRQKDLKVEQASLDEQFKTATHEESQTSKATRDTQNNLDEKNTKLEQKKTELSNNKKELEDIKTERKDLKNEIRDKKRNATYLDPEARKEERVNLDNNLANAKENLNKVGVKDDLLKTNEQLNEMKSHVEDLKTQERTISDEQIKASKNFEETKKKLFESEKKLRVLTEKENIEQDIRTNKKAVSDKQKEIDQVEKTLKEKSNFKKMEGKDSETLQKEADALTNPDEKMKASFAAKVKKVNEEQAAKIETEVSDLKSKKSKLETEKADLESKHNSLNEKLSSTQKKMASDSSDKIVEEHDNLVNSRKDEEAKLNAKNEELKNVREKLSKENDVYDASVKYKKAADESTTMTSEYDRQDAVEKRISRLENEKETLKGNIKATKGEVKENEKEVATLQKQLEDNKSQVAAKKEQVDKIAEEIKSKHVEEQKLKQDLEKKNQKLMKEKEKYYTESKKYKSREEELKTLPAKKKQAQEELSQLNSNFQKKSQEIEDGIASEQKQIKAKDEEIVELNKDLKKQSEDLKELTADGDKKLQQLRAKQSEIQQKEGELDGFAGKNNVARKNLEETQQKLSSAKTEHEQETNTLDQLESKKNLLQTKQDRQDVLTQEKNRSNKLVEQSQELKNKIKKLENDKKALTLNSDGDNESIGPALAKKDREIFEAKLEKRGVDQDLATSQKKVAAHEQLDKLENEKLDLESHQKDVSNSIKKLNSKLQDAEALGDQASVKKIQQELKKANNDAELTQKKIAKNAKNLDKTNQKITENNNKLDQVELTGKPKQIKDAENETLAADKRLSDAEAKLTKAKTSGDSQKIAKAEDARAKALDDKNRAESKLATLKAKQQAAPEEPQASAPASASDLNATTITTTDAEAPKGGIDSLSVGETFSKSEQTQEGLKSKIDQLKKEKSDLENGTAKSRKNAIKATQEDDKRIKTAQKNIDKKTKELQELKKKLAAKKFGGTDEEIADLQKKTAAKTDELKKSQRELQDARHQKNLSRNKNINKLLDEQEGLTKTQKSLQTKSTELEGGVKAEEATLLQAKKKLQNATTAEDVRKGRESVAQSETRLKVAKKVLDKHNKMVADNNKQLEENRINIEGNIKQNKIDQLDSEITVREKTYKRRQAGLNEKDFGEGSEIPEEITDVTGKYPRKEALKDAGESVKDIAKGIKAGDKEAVKQGAKDLANDLKTVATGKAKYSNVDSEVAPKDWNEVITNKQKEMDDLNEQVNRKPPPKNIKELKAKIKDLKKYIKSNDPKKNLENAKEDFTFKKAKVKELEEKLAKAKESNDPNTKQIEEDLAKAKKELNVSRVNGKRLESRKLSERLKRVIYKGEYVFDPFVGLFGPITAMQESNQKNITNPVVGNPDNANQLVSAGQVQGKINSSNYSFQDMSSSDPSLATILKTPYVMKYLNDGGDAINFYYADQVSFNNGQPSVIERIDSKGVKTYIKVIYGGSSTTNPTNPNPNPNPNNPPINPVDPNDPNGNGSFFDHLETSVQNSGPAALNVLYKLLGFITNDSYAFGAWANYVMMGASLVLMVGGMINVKGVIGDFLKVGGIALTIVSVLMIIFGLYGQYKNLTSGAKLEKIDGYMKLPISRVVFATIDAAIATTIAGITTRQMVIVQDQMNKLNDVSDKFKNFSTQGGQTPTMTYDAEKGVNFKKIASFFLEVFGLKNLIADPQDEFGSPVYIHSANDVRMCLDSTKKMDFACECKLHGSCFQFKGSMLPKALQGSGDINKVLGITNNIFSGKKALTELEVPEMKDLAEKMRKVAYSMHEQANKILKKNKKTPMPSFNEMIDQHASVFIKATATQELVDKYVQLQKNLSPGSMHKAFVGAVKGVQPQEEIAESVRAPMSTKGEVKEAKSEKMAAKEATKKPSEVQEDTFKLQHNGKDSNEKIDVNGEDYSGKDIDIHQDDISIWKIVTRRYLLEFKETK